MENTSFNANPNFNNQNYSFNYKDINQKRATKYSSLKYKEHNFQELALAFETMLTYANASNNVHRILMLLAINCTQENTKKSLLSLGKQLKANYIKNPNDNDLDLANKNKRYLTNLAGSYLRQANKWQKDIGLKFFDYVPGRLTEVENIVSSFSFYGLKMAIEALSLAYSKDEYFLGNKSKHQVIKDSAIETFNNHANRETFEYYKKENKKINIKTKRETRLDPFSKRDKIALSLDAIYKELKELMNYLPNLEDLSVLEITNNLNNNLTSFSLNSLELISSFSNPIIDFTDTSNLTSQEREGEKEERDTSSHVGFSFLASKSMQREDLTTKEINNLENFNIPNSEITHLAGVNNSMENLNIENSIKESEATLKTFYDIGVEENYICGVWFDENGKKGKGENTSFSFDMPDYVQGCGCIRYRFGNGFLENSHFFFRPSDPKGIYLIQLDDLNEEEYKRARDYCFYISETSPGNYQGTLAVKDLKNLGIGIKKLERIRKKVKNVLVSYFNADGGATGSYRLPGTLNLNPAYREKYTNYPLTKLIKNDFTIMDIDELALKLGVSFELKEDDIDKQTKGKRKNKDNRNKDEKVIDDFEVYDDVNEYDLLFRHKSKQISNLDVAKGVIKKGYSLIGKLITSFKEPSGLRDMDRIKLDSNILDVKYFGELPEYSYFLEKPKLKRDGNIDYSRVDYKFVRTMLIRGFSMRYCFNKLRELRDKAKVRFDYAFRTVCKAGLDLGLIV